MFRGEGWRVKSESLDTVSPWRGRWLPATLAVIVLAAGLLSLGIWQLARREQRRAANAFLLARLNEPPLRLDGAALDPAAADLRRAVVQGVYDPGGEIVLRNRTLNEHPGVHVLTPLRISGSPAAVLVDRGWIPYDAAGPAERRAFGPPDGPVEVRGVLRRSRERPNALAPADPPLGPDRPRLDAWFRADLPRIQAQMPYPLLPVYLELASSQPPIAQALPRPAPDIALSEGSHLLYALQWFAFAGILIGGYTLLYRGRRTRAPLHRSEETEPWPE
jgi:surfeit locus 1 family protein